MSCVKKESRIEDFKIYSAVLDVLKTRTTLYISTTNYTVTDAVVTAHQHFFGQNLQNYMLNSSFMIILKPFVIKRI